MSGPPEHPRQPGEGGTADTERAHLGPPPGAEAVARRRAELADERALERLEKELDEVESYRMPLMEHLIELKDRVLYSLVALVIGTCIGLYFAKEIYAYLIMPFEIAISKNPLINGGLSLVSSPFEGVYTYLRVGLVAGIVLSLPVVSFQIWQFVAPGLYKTERNIVWPLSVASVVLFLMGAAFCYFGIFPYAFPLFIEILEVDVNLSVNGYLSSIISMMLAFGACFQLPVASFFLSRIGLIDAQDLKGGFRYAIVVIFVIAALITPPDPLTQTLLAIPMVLLYGVAIVIAWLSSTKTRDAETPTEAT